MIHEMQEVSSADQLSSCSNNRSILSSIL
jgi:hypothetical protein